MKRKIDCPGPKGRYCRARKASPAKFAKRSLRTTKRGKVRIVIGCPKGKWDKRKKRCKVGTRVQTILYPLGSPKCRVCPR